MKFRPRVLFPISAERVSNDLFGCGKIWLNKVALDSGFMKNLIVTNDRVVEIDTYMH